MLTLVIKSFETHQLLFNQQNIVDGNNYMLVGIEISRILKMHFWCNEMNLTSRHLKNVCL